MKRSLSEPIHKSFVTEPQNADETNCNQPATIDHNVFSAAQNIDDPNTPVELLAYEFPCRWTKGVLSIDFNHTEIHTEIRVFGRDYWFESAGAKDIESRNKKEEPYEGSDYKGEKTIGKFDLVVKTEKTFILENFFRLILNFRVWSYYGFKRGI